MSLAKRRYRSIPSRGDSLPTTLELEGMLRFADIGFSATKSYRGWLIIYLQVIEILLQKISFRLGLRPQKTHNLNTTFEGLLLTTYASWFVDSSLKNLSESHLSAILQTNFVATRYTQHLEYLSVKVPLPVLQRFARNLMSIANDLRIR